MQLEGKAVIITGASSGIGETTALRCAERGARLTLAARRAEQLEVLAQKIQAQGGEAMVVPTDITKEEQVQQLVATVLERYKQVDVLVNNAGFGIYDYFTYANFHDLERMMQVNLYGVVRCTQAVLPYMLRHHSGQIINVASIAGRAFVDQQAFYSATKYALVGMSRVLQLELSGSGVRCALVCPGPVHTPFIDIVGEEKLSPAVKLIPWLKAEDVAHTIVRAIERDSSGEIIIPAISRPMVALASAFPTLARFIVRAAGGGKSKKDKNH
jgi:hypothetical protein